VSRSDLIQLIFRIRQAAGFEHEAHGESSVFCELMQLADQYKARLEVVA